MQACIATDFMQSGESAGTSGYTASAIASHIKEASC